MNKRTVLRFVVALHLAALAGSGCSSSKSDSDKVAGSLAELGIDDGASLGESTAIVVKPDEEATLTLKTGAEVKVPKGALEAETKLGIERPADKEAMELAKTIDDEQKMASAPYVLTPHGTNFKGEVEVSLPIAKDRDTKKLRVVYLEDEKDTTWEDVGSPESKDGKATIKVKHFSVLMLVEVQNASRPGTSEESDAGPGNITSGSDAGSDVSVDTQDFRARMLQRFEQCGLIVRQGEYVASHLERAANVREGCLYECFLNASCADFIALGCDTKDGSGEAARDAAAKPCLEACGIPESYYDATFCPDGKGADVCDGWEDCADGSDENGCPAGTHFICSNGERVGAGSRCSGSESCTDGSDEDGCPAGIHFVCTNGARVGTNAVCDGYEDCTDKSDEVNCAGKLLSCPGENKTISINGICDAERDCADGSDEPARCLQLTCDWNL